MKTFVEELESSKVSNLRQILKDDVPHLLLLEIINKPLFFRPPLETPECESESYRSTIESLNLRRSFGVQGRLRFFGYSLQVQLLSLTFKTEFFFQLLPNWMLELIKLVKQKAGNLIQVSDLIWVPRNEPEEVFGNSSAHFDLGIPLKMEVSMKRFQ